MEFLMELGLFASKAFFLVFCILVVIITIAIIVAKSKDPDHQLEITHLNKKLKEFKSMLSEHVFSKEEQKEIQKQEKKALKEKEKVSNKPASVFVLSFNGDIKASAVKNLRTEISAILELPNEKIKEVVLQLESPGGMVHGYGLASAQLMRIKQRGIPLTACVDKVAASGGYMMACIADQILSAPFAILGSIGVIAQVPNLNRLLKKNNVDYEEITAGEYKRTISMFGEITEKGRAKFLEEINDTHKLFKEWVSEARPVVDINNVATGEHWYGQRALDKKLADKIMTSDQYIQELAKEHPVYRIKVKEKQNLQQKLTGAAGQIVSEKLPDWLAQWQTRSHY